MSDYFSDFTPIRSTSTKKCLKALTSTESVQNELADQLDYLWDAIDSYLLNGDLTKIDQIIDDWASSLPQYDNISSDHPLLSIIRKIFSAIVESISDHPNPTASSRLYQAFYPLAFYVNEKVALIEIRQIEKQLSLSLEQTQEKMEELEKSKTKFTKIAAHELKTPLTIINGYTSMLRNSIKAENLEMIELVTGIEAGATRMKSIVQDLIDVSLIDNNLLKLSIQPVWLNRLFETIALENADTLEMRKQKLDFVPFEGMQELFYSDPERLLQVLRNIIANAIKYTPDDGVITIHGRQLPGFLEVIITDTGVGIAQQHQLSIFDKFTQIGEIALHSSGKTKFMGGGPGLGLHIAKGILTAMGGSIWVESEGYDNTTFPGSSFHVLIPFNQKKTQI